MAVPILLAAGNVYRARNWPHGVPAPMVSAATLGVQAALLLPLFALLHDGADIVRLGGNWPMLVLVTVAANVSAAYLQRVADSVAYSQIGYVIALTGIGLGALLFGERIGWLFLPALALVFSGIVLVNRPARIVARAPTADAAPQRCPASARRCGHDRFRPGRATRHVA